MLLYELLVGQTPFDAREMMQGGLDALRRIIREKEPLRPSTRLNTLPGEARTTAGLRRQTDVGSVAFSPDGRRILTGSADEAVKVWEAASGLELLTLSGNTTSIWSVAISPDGQQIVTGSADPTATVWRAATSDEVVAWQAEEKAAAQYLANLQRERA